MIIVRWSHPSKLSKKCQTALEMSLHHDLQLTTLYKEFQFSRAMFEDSVRCGHSVTIATKENVAMVMSLIIGKLGSHSLSLPGCMEVLHLLGAPAADQRKEGR